MAILTRNRANTWYTSRAANITADVVGGYACDWTIGWRSPDAGTGFINAIDPEVLEGGVREDWRCKG